MRERVSVMDVARSGSSSSWARRPGLLDRVFPCRMDDLAPGRARYLFALDEAGYVTDDGLLARTRDGRATSRRPRAAPTRMDAWLREGVDRLDLLRTSRPDAQLGVISSPVRTRVTSSTALRRGRSSPRRPLPGVTEIRVAGVVPRGPCGVRGGARVRAPPSPATGSRSSGTRCSPTRATDWISPARARCPRAPPPREGPPLPRSRTRCPTTCRGSSAWDGRWWTSKPWFVGKPALERLAPCCPRATPRRPRVRRPPERLAPRGPPLIERRTVGGWITSARALGRARAARSVSAGSARSTASSRSGATAGRHRARASAAVLGPRGASLRA